MAYEEHDDYLDPQIDTHKAPKRFWLIAIFALIWNLMGIGAYLTQVISSPEGLIEAYGAEQAALISALPAWYTGVFALAVFAGTTASLLLLLKQRVALYLFIFSLICVVVQNVYMVSQGLLKTLHAGEWVMTLMIPLISIFLVWYTQRYITKGLLK